MVRNGIPRVCFYFCSTERNSELFSLELKGSEGNSENLLLFWFHGTEFRVLFSSAEGFGREFREFASCFVQRNGIRSSFLFRGRVRNGIPRAFFSVEQPELRRKLPFVPSIPSSVELFFCRKFPTLVAGQCKASQQNCVHHLKDHGGDGVPRQGHHGKGLQEVRSGTENVVAADGHFIEKVYSQYVP
jgi:hypothetical protein